MPAAATASVWVIRNYLTSRSPPPPVGFENMMTFGKKTGGLWRIKGFGKSMLYIYTYICKQAGGYYLTLMKRRRCHTSYLENRAKRGVAILVPSTRQKDNGGLGYRSLPDTHGTERRIKRMIRCDVRTGAPVYSRMREYGLAYFNPFPAPHGGKGSGEQLPMYDQRSGGLGRLYRGGP